MSPELSGTGQVSSLVLLSQQLFGPEPDCAILCMGEREEGFLKVDGGAALEWGTKAMMGLRAMPEAGIQDREEVSYKGVARPWARASRHVLMTSTVCQLPAPVSSEASYAKKHLAHFPTHLFSPLYSPCHLRGPGHASLSPVHL